MSAPDTVEQHDAGCSEAITVAARAHPSQQRQCLSPPRVRIDVDVPDHYEPLIAVRDALRHWPGSLRLRAVLYRPDRAPAVIEAEHLRVAFHDPMRAEVEACPCVRRCVLEWPER